MKTWRVLDRIACQNIDIIILLFLWPVYVLIFNFIIIISKRKTSNIYLPTVCNVNEMFSAGMRYMSSDLSFTLRCLYKYG